MSESRPLSAADYKLSAKLDEIRTRLLAPEHAAKRSKPLAFFTMAKDRRLPLAFLGHTVSQVIETSFDDLISTPGVGQKKISSLVSLLQRIVAAPPPGIAPAAPQPKSVAALPGDPGFDSAAVTEASWERWRAAVIRHGLGNEMLGRLAHSLQDLPRVVWEMPFSAYSNHSLAEIRKLKTHGEKRVRVILEVFGCAYRMVGDGPPAGHLAIAIKPKFLAPLEQWIAKTLARTTSPDAKEIRRSFVEPLVAQLRIDAGDTIAKLAEGRLGLAGTGSVRQAAKRMGLTRARVYQLLHEAGAIMQVRWPESKKSIAEVYKKLHDTARDGRDLEMFDLAVELFFPSTERQHESGDGGSNNSSGRLSTGLRRQRAG